MVSNGIRDGWPAYPSVPKLVLECSIESHLKPILRTQIHITSDIHITKSGTTTWLLFSPKEKKGEKMCQYDGQTKITIYMRIPFSSWG